MLLASGLVTCPAETEPTYRFMGTMTAYSQSFWQTFKSNCNADKQEPVGLLLLFVAKHDVIALVSRATRIQRQTPQREDKARFWPLYFKIGDFDQPVSRIAASNVCWLAKCLAHPG